MKININADIGESFGKFTIGNDTELMKIIGSANVACGFHAGDPTVMVRTVGLAVENGVSIGAHPGFNDIWGFGRRQIRMEPTDLEYMVTYQIGALIALAGAQGQRVTHVKPHGALNNMAHVDTSYAEAVARGIKAADKELIFVANANSEMTKAGAKYDLQVANEAYVDRRYDETGFMKSRFDADAVIRDAKIAAEQVIRFLDAGGVVTPSGKIYKSDLHSFCIHGDEATAVDLAQELARHLDTAGVEIVPLPQLMNAA